MDTNSRRLIVAGALLAVAVLPHTSAAQAALEPIRVTDSQLRADRLDADAAKIETSDWGELKKAAKLRESAAKLRTADDPKGALSLYWAARDRFYTGDRTAARALMVQSAERAVAIGDVLTAITSFTEAAYIAADIADAGGARAYAERAKLLANSPMLSDAQRYQARLRLSQRSVFSDAVASIAP